MKLKRILSIEWRLAVVLLAMVLWFAQEMVWGNRVPFFRDLAPYFYPLRFILAQNLKAGEIPLWDRHIGMGFPFLAEFQSGVLYPPHIFYLLLPFFAAIRVTFLFHYAVAALGSYMLLRRWTYPVYLSLMGSILFTFGGMTVSLINLQNHFQTAVWLPWLILLGERAVQSCRWKDFVIFTLLSLVQFLAGSPEIYAMSVGLLFLDLLRMKTEERRITYRRLFFLPIAANVLVAALAMIQVLPTAELFLESRWRRPVAFDETALYSLQPLSILNLLFLDREVETSMISGLHPFFLKKIPFLVTHYMGAICLLGLGLWLFYASLKEKGLVLVLVIVSAVFAMGSYTPVYPFVYKSFAFMSFFRFTEKFFFFTYFLLLFAAIRGLFYFLGSNQSSSRGPFLVLGSVALLLLLPYLFFRFDTAPLSWFIAQTTGEALLSSETLNMTSAAIVNLERQIALILGIGLLFFLFRWGKLRPSLFQLLLVGVVFIDLTSANRPYQYFLDAEFIGKNPRVIEESPSEAYRLFYYPGPSNLHPSYYNFSKAVSLSEFNAIFFSNLMPNAGVLYGFDYMQDLDALRRGRYVEFLGIANGIPPASQYRLIAVFNVKYLISLQPLSGEGITLVRHFPQYPSWLYRIDRVVPRAYIVDDFELQEEPFRVLGRLAATEFDPFKKVILEEAFSIQPKRGFKARAEIAKYENQEVTIRASLNGSGILVLADAFYPGWRVYVDGKEEKIFRANFFFRGVRLPAGEHVVEFRYQPRSFVIGLIISLIALSGVVLKSILLALQRRGDS